MAIVPHVNGPAQITLGLGVLGYCTPEGVDFAERLYQGNIVSDRVGPELPVDMINNGYDILATFTLAEWDESVLQSFLVQGQYSGAIGTLGPIGTLRIAGNFTTTMKIASPIDTIVFNFNKAFLVEEQRFTLSSEQKFVALTVRGLPDFTQNPPVVYTITSS